MFITPAYAQAAGAPGAGDFIGMILPLVLIMGAEGEGISPAILERVDDRGSIPMAGSIGSLNVSVAAGIALHVAHAQRANPVDKA